MAVMASRELVIDASPEAIMDALADMDEASQWRSLHRELKEVDRYPDGRPHHVKATVKIMGITDKELLEYHWGDDWMVWDAADTFQQRSQQAEYKLTREGDRTRVRFDIIVDLVAPIPEFLLRRARKLVLDAAVDRLRARVTRLYG